MDETRQLLQFRMRKDALPKIGIAPRKEIAAAAYDNRVAGILIISVEVGDVDARMSTNRVRAEETVVLLFILKT